MILIYLLAAYELQARQQEALTAVADGDVAYWEKNYADALRCYTKVIFCTSHNYI